MSMRQFINLAEGIEPNFDKYPQDRDIKTKITFNNLNRKDIIFYVKNYNPYDKAGGYGIQDWIGLIGIKKIEGDFNNVVGLPTSMLHKKLSLFV